MKKILTLLLKIEKWTFRKMLPYINESEEMYYKMIIKDHEESLKKKK